MAEKTVCDICGEEIRFTYGTLSRRVRKGEGTIRAKKPLRRRIVRWLLGPYYRWREWTNEPFRSGGSYNHIHVCSGCRRKIREEAFDG